VRLAPPALTLCLALLAAPTRAPADGGLELEGSLLLHTRATARLGEPQTQVLFDRTSRTFEVRDYLRPVLDQRYLSGFLAGSLEGRAGPWRFELSADTGEVRRSPSLQGLEVCASNQTPAHPAGSTTGLDVRGAGGCNGATVLPGLPRGNWAVAENVDGPRETLQNGRSPAEELRQTWLWREAWVGLATGTGGFAFLRAGRHRFAVAEGFVYDDYGLGVEARLDLGAIGPQWDLGAALFWPTRDWPTGTALRSPMLVLRADRLLSLFDHVGAFAAFARDTTGGVAELFRGAEVEPSAVRLQGLPVDGAEAQAEAQRLAGILDLDRRYDDSASLLWFGLAGSLTPAPLHRATFLAAVSTGRIHITAPEDVQATVLGAMAQASWEVRVHRELLLEARLLYVSGDVPPAERQRAGLNHRYRGFVGIAPWVSATNLFFRGGLSETFAARQASAPGVNGRGVYGPIVKASWDPRPGLRAELKGAWLAAPEVGPYGGRVYGPEVDLNLRWAPLPWLALSLEADSLWPGDFFGSGGGPVRKLILGLDLTAP
jgi:hypothetical protein